MVYHNAWRLPYADTMVLYMGDGWDRIAQLKSTIQERRGSPSRRMFRPFPLYATYRVSCCRSGATGWECSQFDPSRSHVTRSARSDLGSCCLLKRSRVNCIIMTRSMQKFAKPELAAKPGPIRNKNSGHCQSNCNMRWETGWLVMGLSLLACCQTDLTVCPFIS